MYFCVTSVVSIAQAERLPETEPSPLINYIAMSVNYSYIHDNMEFTVPL